MIAVTIAIFLVDGMLILALLWLSVNGLYRQKRNLDASMGARRPVNVVRLLMAAPPVVVIIVAILFFFVLQNDFFLGFAHAFFLLGMWMAISISIFALLLLMRLKHTLQLAAMLAFLGAIIPVLYFTPTLSFQSAFGQAGQVGYIFPLIEGLAIIGVCYPILLRFNKVLR